MNRATDHIWTTQPGQPGGYQGAPQGGAPGYQGYQGQPGGYQGYQGQPGGYQGYQGQPGAGGYPPGYQQPPKKKSPWLKILAIGCLGITILMVIGCITAFVVIRGAVHKLRDQYTSTSPKVIPAVQLPPEAIQDTQDRANAFAEALKAGQSAEPLVLTADEINALIQNHPDWTEAEGMVYVSMDDDLLKGEVSVPLDKLGEMFKGRYANGSASFDVMVRNGQLYVYMRELTVNEKSVPQEIMQSLSSENMAKDLNTNNPEAAEFFRKIESLEIKDGKMIIIPRP